MEPLLSDRGPAERSHNLSAGALRRGLAVTAFALLETYFESRFNELLGDLAACPWAYGSYSDGLQKLITLNAAIGLATKVGFASKIDKLPMAERGIAALAGYSATPPVYTSLGFSPKGSNVHKDDVSACLRALGAQEPWAELAGVASRTGSARVNIADDYKAVSDRRNACAHNSKASIPTTDLRSHLEIVTILGIGFDVIASSLVSRICNASSASEVKSTSPALAPKFRFLDHDIAGLYSERSAISGRSVKNYMNETAGRAGLLSRASAPTEFRIIRNTQRVPIELF